MSCLIIVRVFAANVFDEKAARQLITELFSSLHILAAVYEPTSLIVEGEYRKSNTDVPACIEKCRRRRLCYAPRIGFCDTLGRGWERAF